ncbi:Lrp/AsnC ligand binding domain-containing protein [Meiothermus granaticius]|uniref:Lrp/AsnC ligand binding domain protein n=1 Tax=Meiothermus granaticius NBRC 107808 TaxID=1227551 RepID=A0A399FA11_9DEIN|nr:Lrp/AsnC ligand binding domain-containing protein [Meiothermus granaticius]RIH91742.1 Lrp/AsnC ligand binding domain protein [Meiothermus granaticius NBRC 107808]GEM88134.1 hypothetical protein MGR01S_27590 [Meiothermus granaticius NBRC 107808]
MLREALMAMMEMKARQAHLLEEARVMQLLHRARHSEAPQKVSAYVFVSACQPKRVAWALRRIPGVLKADALSGTSEALLVVEQRSLEELHHLLYRVESIPGVQKVLVRFAA